MTPTEFRRAMETIGWTQRGLATLLGVHETRTRRWASGAILIPEDIAKWLAGLARLKARHTAEVQAWLRKNLPPIEDKSHGPIKAADIPERDSRAQIMIMARAGHSQASIARAMGISRQRVNKILADATNNC